MQSIVHKKKKPFDENLMKKSVKLKNTKITIYIFCFPHILSLSLLITFTHICRSKLQTSAVKGVTFIMNVNTFLLISFVSTTPCEHYNVHSLDF